MEQSKLANDYLHGYTGTYHYYKTLLKGFYYTDGVQALCEKFECYWFMDVVMSYQPEIKKGKYGNPENIYFQEWVLEKTSDDTAIVKCFTDAHKGGGCIIQQEIPYTDFPGKEHHSITEAIIWVANDVAYLPSEE
jgi:hypothetical protein